MHPLSRRELFATALALASSNPLPVIAKPKLGGFPFTLGVASGEPAPDGAVLWTRLLAGSTGETVELKANIPVKWEIAEDEGFGRVTRNGSAMATPALAHSVHVEASGLKPSREYWYRFEADGHRSPAGRFRTAPAKGEVPPRFRFAFASCQQWTQGLWTAYKHMAQEDLDLVIHLGDYIYEKGYRGEVRPEGRDEIFTLADYRKRHTLYKSDPLLQAAHARFAWMTTWDDHEVSNNYVSDMDEKGQPRDEFLKRRAWAYQAFYEHMPLRRASRPDGPDMRLHRRSDFGSLLRLHMLDTRQYRTDQACMDGIKKPCADLTNPEQTVLGSPQEKWLQQGLESSDAVWNVLGQQIFFTLADYDPGPEELFSMDSWNGYPVARKRMVQALSERTKRNTVIITGDVHASWVGQVHTEMHDTSSPCVATEFVGTSISSGGDGADMTERGKSGLSANPQIRYYNARRGYVRCEVTPKNWRTDYRLLDYVTRPGSAISTSASFTIEPGRLVVERS